MVTHLRFWAAGSSARVIRILVILALAVRAGAAAQVVDEAYTEKILEYTTESFFLTPYVDHLPASATVPTPLDFLGHIVGAADILSYPHEVHDYMRAVAAASPRVEVFSIGETEEGREMIVVVVADDATIGQLDRYKGILARLADPRVTAEADARRLTMEGKPIYWATGAIHSPETGSPEMLMELVYRLAVDETPFVKAIRDSIIFMATPVVEVDGRAKVVDLHMGKRKDPDANLPTRPLYWGKYVAHDNNRDGIGLSLKLSQNINNTFYEYHPTILHDLHESASHLYTSTGRGPYNAWFDPIVINEWNNIAYEEVREMTALGVPGVYTHDFYDGWAPNYMFSVAHMHNAIGRFYETQGAGDASTRIINSNVERQWHRPNTPLSQVTWSIRNNVNLQQSALLIALNYVARHKQGLLENFYRKGARAVAKATAEGPAAYIFPAGADRPGMQVRLLTLLMQQRVEVHRSTGAFQVGDVEYGSGSYVVRMDQPYSRAADMLLDKQYYNPNDPRPYDDVGWTLGPLFDTRVVRVEDPSVLEVDMELVSGPLSERSGVEGGRGVRAYVIAYDADNELASFRFKHGDLLIDAADTEFELEGDSFPAGSFIIPVTGNPANLVARIATAASEFGFVAQGTSSVPDVSVHAVAVPRVAIVHTWTTTQSEGWLRIGFDEYGIPYDYVSVHDVRDEPNLRSRYDVLVFGPSTSDALSLVYGLSGDEPIPWKKSEVTPNIGYNAETDDMRGGLELDGVMNLTNFVKQGGLLVTLTSSSTLPIHFGLARGVSVKDTPALWARGGVFRAQITDRKSPIVYGFGEELGVYFNTAPVFAQGRSGFGQFGRFGGPTGDPGSDGSTTSRRTGRGGTDEGDIVQGRARDLGEAGVEEFRRRQEESEGDGRTRGGTVADRSIRTIARFASEPDEVLISGGIRNPEELANAPALLDARLGDGHILMFSFNPFWRGETQGSYALVFNALMHFDHLDTEESLEEVATSSGSN